MFVINASQLAPTSVIWLEAQLGTLMQQLTLPPFHFHAGRRHTSHLITPYDTKN